MLSCLLREDFSPSGWIYDAESVMHFIGHDGFVRERRSKPLVFYGTDGKPEVQFGGSGGLLHVPAVTYETLGEVEGAAERLFAAAAMSREALRASEIDAYFETLGMQWVKTVLLAGEYLALPDPEHTGRWATSKKSHGLFVYTGSIVRVLQSKRRGRRARACPSASSV